MAGLKMALVCSVDCWERARKKGLKVAPVQWGDRTSGIHTATC